MKYSVRLSIFIFATLKIGKMGFTVSNTCAQGLIAREGEGARVYSHVCLQTLCRQDGIASIRLGAPDRPTNGHGLLIKDGKIVMHSAMVRIPNLEEINAWGKRMFLLPTEQRMQENRKHTEECAHVHTQSWIISEILAVAFSLFLVMFPRLTWAVYTLCSFDGGTCVLFPLSLHFIFQFVAINL